MQGEFTISVPGVAAQAYSDALILGAPINHEGAEVWVVRSLGGESSRSRSGGFQRFTVAPCAGASQVGAVLEFFAKPERLKQLSPCCAGAGIKWGKDAQGQQRYKCKSCGGTYLGSISIAKRGTRLRPRLLLELLRGFDAGESGRSIARRTGVHRDTIGRIRRRMDMDAAYRALVVERARGCPSRES